MENLHDVLSEQVRDLYSAETQLMQALPNMAEAASSKDLKKAFTSHLKETETQVKRLEKIGKMLDIEVTGHTCQAMKGLLKEGMEAIETRCEEPSLHDVLLVAAAQRVEHYEMSGYGTAATLAKHLKLKDIEKLLVETLDEEKEADLLLTKICTKEILGECTK